MRGLVVLILSLTTLIAIACGGSGGRDQANATSRVSATETPAVAGGDAARDSRGYLAVETDGVMFIQWTETDDHLTGQVQVVYASPNPPFELGSRNAALSGVRNGSNLTLTISGFRSSEENWTGTLDGDKLTIVWPHQSGLLGTTVLRPGTVEEYNEAAQAFRERIQQQAQRAREATAEAQRRAEQQRAEAARQATQAAQQAERARQAAICQYLQIGKKGSNTMVVFSGPKATETCITFLNTYQHFGYLSDSFDVRTADPSLLPEICSISTADVTVTVRDTAGSRALASVLCSDIDDWLYPRIGYIGVDTKDVQGANRSGAEVTWVKSGSPAEQAGLMSGDIITQVEARQISQARDIVTVTKTYPAGTRVSVTFVRNGATHVVAVTMGTPP